MDNYKDRFEEVLKTAFEYGVEKIVIPGVEPSGIERILSLCRDLSVIHTHGSDRQILWFAHQNMKESVLLFKKHLFWESRL